MESVERRFAQLTGLVLDGVCTDAERAELTQLADQRPELALEVVDEAIVHSLLKWHSGSITESVFPPATLAELEQPSVIGSKHPHSTRRRLVLRWAVAAMLLVSGGLGVWQLLRPLGEGKIIADVVSASQIRWADGTTALKDDATVVAGRLISSDGEYELRFRNGPVVRVVGAATFDIKSDMLIQLEQGQLTAQISKSNIGFTIESPMVNVIDQGTQFGISVGKERADVVVFDGKVDLQSKSGDSNVQRQLIQGNCVKIDHTGSIQRVEDVRRDVHGRWWTDDRAAGAGHVIASVSDNIHGDGDGTDEFSCYQTTFEGLHEEAIAYSDNPNHQWNGLTKEGLPKFLVGADYVQTFNNYRYDRDFKIQVKLARPANLYVFFDDRIDPPAWLTADFVDTGVDIGLDEGAWLDNVEEKYRALDTHTTAEGAGESIDNVFSVWRRRCVEGGTISLGYCSVRGPTRRGLSGRLGRSMYGIAATPLESSETASAALSLDAARFESVE